MKTDFGWQRTNKPHSGQTTVGIPGPPPRTPAPEAGPPTLSQTSAPTVSAFTAVLRCKSGTLGNEREIVRGRRAEFK